MKGKNKILMIFWGELYPTDMGNKKLVTTLLEILSKDKGCYVTLCLISKSIDMSKYKNTADEVILIPSPALNFIVKVINKVLSLLTINYLKKNFIYHLWIKNKIHSLVNKSDTILLNYIDHHYLIPENKWSNTTVITHDIQFFRLESFRAKNIFRRLLISQTKKLEIRLLSRAKNIVVLADYEKNILSNNIPEDKIHIMNLPINVPTPDYCTNFVYDFLFVGGDSLQNEKAFELFLEKIYCLFNDKTICLVGGICKRFNSASFKKRYPNVEFLGFVEDVSQIYNKSRFAVGTIDVGSGVKVKILEAMAYGKVVLTNTKGLEGINATHGIHIVNIDCLNDRGLVTLINNLYINENYLQISNECRNYIKNNYSLESVSKILKLLIFEPVI